jgi:hypothetical protein
MDNEPRKRIGIGWVLLGCFSLLMAWMVFQWFRPSPPIIVSRQTTFLTQPLGPDGLPDYPLARRIRLTEGISPENNAAIPVWQAMGRSDWEPGQWQTLAEKLRCELPHGAEGLSRMEEDVMEDLIEWIRPRVSNLDDEADHLMQTHWLTEQAATVFYETWNRPWRSQDCPPLADLIGRSDHAFGLLHDAANRPRFYTPIVSPDDDIAYSISFHEISAMRSLTRVLTQRAYMRMGDGELSAAWDDLRAGILLSNTFRCDTNVELMVRSACHGMFKAATLHLLSDPRLTASIADDIAATFEQIPDAMKLLQNGFDGEQLFIIENVVRYAVAADDRLEIDDFAYVAAKGLIRGSVDWNVTLEKTNALFDELQNALAIRDAYIRMDRLKSLELRLENDGIHIESPWVQSIGYINPAKRSRIVADSLISEMSGTFTMVVSTAEKMSIGNALIVVAARLASYRASSGELPESLATLTPDVFPTPPVDPIFGSQIRYRRLADGGMLVYCLGGNGRDEGGSNHQLETFRGVRLPMSYQFDGSDFLEVAKERLTQAGEWDSIEQPLNPDSWIAADADDISLRSPLSARPLDEMIRQMTIPASFDDGDYGDGDDDAEAIFQDDIQAEPAGLNGVEAGGNPGPENLAP